MAFPRIYADFQNLDDCNRLRLTCAGTRQDLERQGIQLQEGLVLTFYTDDADDDGQPDELRAGGVVHYDEDGQCWVATIDWTAIRHASEEEIACSPMPSLDACGALVQPVVPMEAEFRDIKSLLEAGELDRLIGRVESAVFEAKGPRPYDFTQAFDRWELAKDVASFANSVGGFIIIGLAHERLAGQDMDQVSALDLIEESVFEAHRYESIVREYVDRKISGLQAKWIEHKSSPGRGVGVIHIPPQSNDAKPFLLKQLDESGQTRQLVFGIVFRKGAHSVPSTMEELRKALSHGTSNTATRLTRIEEQLASMRDQLLAIDENQQQMLAAQQQPAPAPPPPPDLLDSRIEQALEDE